MPLITTSNRNSVILQDLINWLSQLKDSTVINERLGLGEVAAIGGAGFDVSDITLDQLAVITLDQLSALQLQELDCTVRFYADAARSILVFTDNTSNTSAFSIVGKKMYYTPPDSLINSATGLSTTLNQQRYYVTATYTDGTVVDATYGNAFNLMFESVIVSNTPTTPFSLNVNQAIIVPCPERQENKSISGLHGFIIASYDVYVQFNVFERRGLSDYDRIVARQKATNLIRNALYIDRYRNNTCTLKDANLNGTMVRDMKPVASDVNIKGVIRVDTVYWADGDSGF